MKSLLSRSQSLKTRDQRGQALLELVPVMVVLLTLTFAVIDFGRAIWQVEVMTGLTREGSNLASRNTPLPDSVNAVISDGAALNLSSNGRVIITSVQNVGTASSPSFVITDQYISPGKYSAASKVGTYIQSATTAATLPSTATTMPQPGGTIYVTEVFCSFSPITPLGALVSYAVPANLYDAAYF